MSRPGNRLRAFNRRRFIQGAGVLGGAAIYDAVLARARLIPTHLRGVIANLSPSELSEIGSVLSYSKPSVSFTLRRREDFLFLRVDGFNLGTSGQRLVRRHPGHPAYIVFTFEPQHLAEEAFLSPGGSPKSPGGSKASLAYPSRLAFIVPDGRTIPLTVGDLLDWARLHPSLSYSASYDGVHIPHRIGPILNQPTLLETSIELPWRLVISPRPSGRWSHPSAAITSDGFTEAWHTRLADGPAETAPDGGAIRAIWNFDLDSKGHPTLQSSNPPTGTDSFLTSLSEHDRWEIVTATSNFAVSGRKDVTANKLWLSTRGGYLDSIGNWDSSDFSLAEWKHQATLGRDQYVKVVYKGYLLPFGHKAVYTIVSEREFEKVNGEIVATFRQIRYVVVREPLKVYTPDDTYGLGANGRAFPFRSLEVTTLRTPDIETPKFVYDYGDEDPFFPTLADGSPFQWHFVGTDWMGQTAEFTAPALFVNQDQAWEPGPAARITAAYDALSATDARRIGTFNGTEVAFAEPFFPGDTNHGLHSIVFGAASGPNAPTTGTTKASAYVNADQPIWYPVLRQAEITLSAAGQATGGTAAPTALVKYNDYFVIEGFNSAGNRANLYLEMLPGSSPGLSFGGGSSGGVITPNLVLAGLSRSLGPVAGDLDELLAGKFDPTSVFDNLLGATILGGVKLKDLIAVITGISGDDLTTDPMQRAMKIVYNTAGSTGIPSPALADLAARTGNAAEPSSIDARSGVDETGLAGASPIPTVPPIPTTKTTHFHWEPEFTSNPIVTTTSQYPCVLDGVVTANLKNPADSTFSLTGILSDFAVNLMSTDTAEFITIQFNSLTFTAAKGQKSHVVVDIANVSFDGPLTFVQQLEDFMDFSGDGGPKITVEPDGISADLSVTLPPIGVGVFSLSNIGIDVGFNLPFIDGPARFRFSFSTQDNPFTLSVAIFGGGGFFGIAIGTDGVELIQASFDFGAMDSVDLGVASGSVQLVAGIYFSYGEANGQAPATCILTGFVKLDGSLSILGIITLSLTFDLSLTWQDAGGVSSVTGTATLSVSVSVAFFSFSVSVTASKTFGGGSDGTNALPHSHADGHARAERHRLAARNGPDSGSDTPPTFVSQVPTQAIWNDYCNAFATN